MHLTGFTAALTALTLSLLSTPSSAHLTTSGTIVRRNSTYPRLAPTTRYSEQAFIGTHHSAMLRTHSNGFSLSGNQFHNITVQLDAGVRLLQGQTFSIGNDIRICHSSCALLDGGSIQDILTEVSTFLKRFQGEIITFMWTNPGGNVPLSMIDRAYKRAGLDSISYVPPHTEMNLTDWPTMEELVLANRRVVTFIDTVINQTEVPYILPTWSFVRETPAFVTDDHNFACGTGSDQSPPGQKLAMVNHVLYQDRVRSGQRFPNVQKAELTNAATGKSGALLNHLDTCYSSWNRRPNFVMVDFFDRGNVFLAQDVVNGLVPHPAGTTPASLHKSESDSVANTQSPFITLSELLKEQQKEKEEQAFKKEVEEGRKRAGITEDQVKNGQGLAVFTFTRTNPPLVEETQGVVNAGANRGSR
ncbi:hypothetical protein L211DRAFT_515483 [Terfezia boudieri ATCC MYA-4762]|uniref:PLC-like phosphodiesterase n=1 Tax=Terfezia boudieri ATCC MYA-4762 TaxID=1051890 RepID=A0A3N4LCU8_9PEZI|nr:hypothetical protein L211DRAFT_515483 [Terfezia boudieri ATCC MYA-4762]